MSGRGRGRGRGPSGRGGGRSGGRSGGRGAYGGGRSSGGRGGGGGGGRGGGGGGGGAPKKSNVGSGPPPSTTLTNVIPCQVSPNFQFFLYGIDACDKNGKVIDGRRRRLELFMKGVLDKTNGYLARKKMTKKEIENFERGIFFEGSYFFSSRAIPGLTSDKFPTCLVSASEQLKEHDEAVSCPISDNGDSLNVVHVQPYTAPSVIAGTKAEAVKGKETFELRCADCNSCFTSLQGLLSHCKETGHRPLYSSLSQSNDAIPSNKEVFLSFVNVALQRAMGERMARWGREYIDPKSETEPVDRNGRSLGVKVFRAYSCEFGMHALVKNRKLEKPQLTLTVDLCAKILRTKTLLEAIHNGKNPNNNLGPSQQNQARRTWNNEVVICVYDKRCYSVIDLVFDKSPASLPVQVSYLLLLL